VKVILDRKGLQASQHLRDRLRLSVFLTELLAMDCWVAYSPLATFSRDDLHACDVLVITTRSAQKLDYTPSEIRDICDFVRNGGGLLLMSNPIQDVVLIDLGDRYEAGFTLMLKKKASGFIVSNAYSGFKAECPSILKQIWGRSWHHIAFTYAAGSDTLNYFIDGVLQETVSREQHDRLVGHFTENAGNN